MLGIRSPAMPCLCHTGRVSRCFGGDSKLGWFGRWLGTRRPISGFCSFFLDQSWQGTIIYVFHQTRIVCIEVCVRVIFPFRFRQGLVIRKWLDTQQRCSSSPRIPGVEVSISVVLSRWIRRIALGCDRMIAAAHLRFRPDLLLLDRSGRLRRWGREDRIDGIVEETLFRKD